MILDWLLYLVLVIVAAKGVNRFIFNAKPAARWSSWLLSGIVYVVSLIVLSVLKAIRYKSLSESLGHDVVPREELDFVGAALATILFFALLNRTKTNVHSAPAGEQ